MTVDIESILFPWVSIYTVFIGVKPFNNRERFSIERTTYAK
jgi:hypothetical protein